MNEPNPDETADSAAMPPPDLTIDSGLLPAHASESPSMTIAQGVVSEKHSALQSRKEIVATGEPERLGRYTVLRKLGSGGYGVVYLALDETLERVVAVKVPRGDRVRPEQIEDYLNEAKLVANLEHPAIVRVYDCGTTDDGRCYVVSQYVDGGDLADWLKTHKAEPAFAVELIMRICEALHHAHKNRIVHRDVKPSNILLDGNGVAFLADFGLALREEDFGRGSNYAGTPRYMSPEQARGEGHRVDGRSDLYSIGVVLYEMLCGRVPFIAESITGLLDQIQVMEPPPLRLHADTVPPELERIVSKVLSKRAADRYGTALDFVDDLKTWLDGERRKPSSVNPSPSSASGPSAETPGSTVPDRVENRPPRVVPKGLRAFDANDADFFLRLLPGARDRDGLPESVRFWKLKVEQADSGLAVGLIYGPSGCGKSSFVKAGLLPRLPLNIDAVTLDATPEGTEAKLMQLLVAKGAVKAPTLSETMLLARKRSNSRTVIVIDQFEQWLAAHPTPDDCELTNSLRQADGLAMKVLLLIRDDFWMAATRLFRALEIPLQQGTNSAAVDLFDRDHARKVLAGFGRAYGKLPAKRTDYTPAQIQFLDRAVSALADSTERIVCVRLALFAEMVKNRTWDVATLEALGGLEGVGTVFLEEAFGGTAAPNHRYHATAARAVLEKLLPPAGAVIKSTPAGRAALMEASGYQDRPRDFDDLIKLLDSELRLITPAEVEGAREPHYQLTHDFLVPSLREWLTHKRRETKRGRAELLLEERAALWQAKPSRRAEPGLLEWLQIRTRTVKRTWTPPQRAMMQRTGRRLARQGVALCVMAGMITFGLLESRAQQRHQRWLAKSNELVALLANADALRLPDIIGEINRLEPSMRDRLAAEQAAPGVEPNLALRFSLATASGDSLQLQEHYTRLADGDPLQRVALELLLKRDDLRGRQLLELLDKTPQTYFNAIVQKLIAARGASENVAEQSALLATVAGWESTEDDFLDELLGDANELKSMTPDELRSRYLKLQDRFERDYRKLAKYMLAAYRIGEMKPALEVLGGSPTELQATIISLLRDCQCDPTPLIEALLKGPWLAESYGLLLAVGSYEPKQIPEAVRGRLVARLETEAATNPLAGVHSAAEWVLRRWGQPARDLTHKQGRDWVANGQGHAFAKFREAKQEFRMGALPGETDRVDDRNRHHRIIPRAFAIGMKEVTIREFRACFEDYKSDKKYHDSDNCPATGITWHDAANFCNWLSELELLPTTEWCFLPAEDGQLQLAPNYLKRKGYRLPTEAEWEFAARGGGITARHYGISDALLPQYAWFNSNSAGKLHAVGLRMPNAYGLFDTLGNANEWCISEQPKPPNNVYPRNGSVIDEPAKSLEVLIDQPRMIRSGSFYSTATDLRSARRQAAAPKQASPAIGFRLARTLVQDQ